jgi:glycosyltransferase involved in cell wall biosynthesis
LAKTSSNIGIVLNPSGILFGGAQKRFTNLFQYLYNTYPGSIYYFVSKELFQQIEQLFPDFKFENVIVLKNLELNFFFLNYFRTNKKKVSKVVLSEIANQDLIGNSKDSLVRTVIKHLKNRIKQYYIFMQIETVRRKKNIKVFLGVFNGILPLYFYLNKKQRSTGIIFSDMDSWFSNINNPQENAWHKKYISFNYGLEKSDIIDFLSPYILSGILKRGIVLKKESINITTCSFSDYSKCIPGNKKEFIVSFAGRLFPDKNPVMFLEAAKIINKKFPYVKFYLMGDGESYLQKEIIEFIRLNNLSQSLFFGFHPNPPEIFSESTIFVSIQTTNNYPSQSVLEAMACGNAIIASDVGDTRMFINEDVGLLISLDLDSLVNALLILINDKELAITLGKNARDFVLKNHTIERCSNYYINLFEQTQLLIVK